MKKQIDSYKYRIILIDAVNNHKNIKLLDKIRSIASKLSTKPEEVYDDKLTIPVLKYVKGTTNKAEHLYSLIFGYGNGFYTEIKNPEFIVEIFVNNKWEEITASNFKRILTIIFDK